jgi:hypothetical protein
VRIASRVEKQMRRCTGRAVACDNQTRRLISSAKVGAGGAHAGCRRPLDGLNEAGRSVRQPVDLQARTNGSTRITTALLRHVFAQPAASIIRPASMPVTQCAITVRTSRNLDVFAA